MRNGQRLARSGLGPSSNSHAPFRFVGLTSSESFFVALALSAGDLACSLAPRSSGRQDGNTGQYEGDLGVTCDFYSRGNASGNRGGNNQFEVANAQLQAENETINEYVTLYREQRAALKQMQYRKVLKFIKTITFLPFL